MSEDEPEAVEPDGQESDAQPPEARVPGARVPGVQPRGTGLSERDMAVLAFERRGWSAPGVKERAIREQLEMSPTRYYQLLNALLDDTHALAHDPVTVNRLRRRREAQRARR
jgi:hypothetical protein